jgi:hypothetical protein
MAYSFRFENGDIKKLADEAINFVKGRRNSGSLRTDPPICYLGEGRYIFRIYPDRDINGFPLPL